MTPHAIKRFDQLKNTVIEIAGLDTIAPGDCKFISVQIFSKTERLISETTLKRVFGFARSRFYPSLYTLDAMAKFCGYQSWAQLGEDPGSPADEGQVNNWRKTSHMAYQVTVATLQTLQNKSGIPYGQTISREFMNTHFAAFEQQDCGGMVICAPAGYGKTIALCHWIKAQLEVIANGPHTPVILFFSSNAFMHACVNGYNLHEWLSVLLGCPPEDQPTMLSGPFYLVIDGLDERVFSKDQFQLLLGQLLDVAAHYRHNGQFKVVLTMRPITWLNHRHEFETAERPWYLGQLAADDSVTNVPLFSTAELRELVLNINPRAMKGNIDMEMATHFRYPLYFQFYYKQHKLDLNFGEVDPLTIYELVSDFILNKVYLGFYATEKVLLTWSVLEHMDFSAGIYQTPLLSVYPRITAYKRAYQDLLGSGFLRELNQSGSMKFDTVIRFGSDDFLHYSLASQLLRENQDSFDDKLVGQLNKNFSGERKVQLVKWCILFSIKSGQLLDFELLSHLNLPPEEKVTLDTFLVAVFKKLCSPSLRAEQ